jgi:hypothetical protein
MLTRSLKQKNCEHCGSYFIPLRPMQQVCGPRCATRKVKADKAKGKAELRERKKALKTIPDLIKEAQHAFNAFIRERDKDQPCVCCGRVATGISSLGGHGWDAGHYRSTGSAPHLRFNEQNCHRQLVLCNRYGAGRAVDYRIGLIQRIGIEAVEALETDNRVHKWQRDELIAIRDRYRQKLKELKACQ